MAKRHDPQKNNSDQVKIAFQHGDPPENHQKDKQEVKSELKSKESSGQVQHCSTCSCSSHGPSSTKDDGCRQEEGNKRGLTKREEEELQEFVKSSQAVGPPLWGAAGRTQAEGNKRGLTKGEEDELNRKGSSYQANTRSRSPSPFSRSPIRGAAGRTQAEGDNLDFTKREDDKFNHKGSLGGANCCPRSSFEPPSTRNGSHRQEEGHKPERPQWEDDKFNSKGSSSQPACGPSSTDDVSRKRAEGYKPGSTKRDNSVYSSDEDWCSTSSSPSSPSSRHHSAGAAGRRQAERDGQWTLSEDVASSCCQPTDLKRLPHCHKLKPVEFGSTHTVLIDMGALRVGALAPQDGRDVWHSNFVKMPHSHESLMTKTGFTVRRWEVISKQLKDLAKKSSVSVDEVKKAIIKCNPKYKDQWTFDALSTFVKSVPQRENYIGTLFPKIAALALKLPKYVKKAIPLLQSGRSASITLSQRQISILLANAFFCTFPHRNANHPKAEYHNYPSINFTSLFGNSSNRKNEKLRAIMHYFKEVTETKPEGLVTFERRCSKDTDIGQWRSCKEKMPKLHVTSDGTIETEGVGMLQVDFAASWLGGGVLSSGLVQEEILFLIHPELIVCRLFTERLDDNECLIITGPQRFSCYTGFSDKFQWLCPYEDHLGRDEWKRLNRQIVAIDALHFKQRWEQYDMRKVTRELNKAYCGFKGHGPDIATGKWGCGAFNGDPQLKAVIQLMAAARAKRGLAFFTFGDDNLTQGLQKVYHLLVTEGMTVDKLFRLLEDFCHSKRGSHVDLFEFIRNTIKPSRSLL